MNTTIKPQENPKYLCECCNFKTRNKKDYEKHIMTPKHAKKTQILQNTTGNTTKNPHLPQISDNNYTCSCGKSYKHHSSLWYHKKTCDSKQENITMSVEEYAPENNQFSTDLILELLKQNQEFKELIIEQNKQMLEMSKDRGITNNSNNVTQNNNFNLQVFLNETCKDALNLSDFLESLILTLTDFENFGPLGYCGGITNILVNGLNKLDITKRPIHCSDLKREVIHVKNNDTWHKDQDKEQMIKAIKAIEHKNVKQMNLWAKANPEYKDPTSKKSDLYTKLIDNSLGETDKEKAQKNYNKIIRSIAKEILVDK
uniref:C2H2-type domain-containing protein n=1 Tax=viral metagenome TaxID=1070528 RepID=A0A6C0CUY9_9ZZZZ